MPDTLPYQEPFPANECLSHLVEEATGQTFKGNSFIQLDANGRAAAAPATPTDGSLLTNIGFTLEPGHNFSANKLENMVEVLDERKLIEITLGGAAVQTDLVPGKGFGLSIDPTTGFYYADRTKTTHTVVEFVRISGRGVLPNGKAIQHTGIAGDTRIRIIVRIKDSAAIRSGN